MKTAMLAGDKRLVSVLRTLKGVMLDAEISKSARESGLPEDEVIGLLQREYKKRGDAALIYEGANDAERTANERYEQEVLAKYLPAQLGEDEITQIIDTVLPQLGEIDIQQMGKVIGAVKAKTGPAGDGAMIAKLVKERLSK